MAGAREKFPEETEEAVRGTEKSESQGKILTSEPAKSAPVQWIAGFCALAALLVCLVLPITVFLRGMDNYEANLAFMKKVLIAATLVYFVSGIFWIIHREKEI